MKKFVFRFKAVLKQRTIIEETRLLEFNRVQSEISACEKRLSECRLEVERTMAGRPAAIDVTDVPRRERYLDVLKQRILQEERLREAIQVRLEDARTLLVSARQARLALERIQDSDMAEYRREMAHAEQNALDEIASQQFVRAQHDSAVTANS